MENPAAMLNCSNTRCQAPNPQSNKFCQQCRTPLLRRYLWAIGQTSVSWQSEELIDDRYLVVSQQVLLDTKPGILPQTPAEIPQHIAPYLRLSPQSLNIPQVYGCLNHSGRRNQQVWLLEDAPLSTGSPLMGEADSQGQLLPELSSIWKETPDVMRQLNWLWQIAQLWEPMSREGVATSLLTPSLLRVEGSLVRLLELQADSKKAPKLAQLGQFWQQSLLGTAAPIAEFFQKLCSQLVEGQLGTSEQLIALLAQALYNCGQRQQRTYQVFTASDKGPSRDHNEDACYPASGHLRNPVSEQTLAIVCDGIGGHEGGEVASSLAIKVLQERLEKHQTKLTHYAPTALIEELETSVCAANDAISEQNDSERRSDRQRMGTTLVMGRTYAHEMYITHVGDSRVYWITRYNCHQITQDDDLASRELRLGYALYRSAIQQPASGSLVQALGMASSTTLHPTVQPIVLDEDSIFLLCSDGLSDNDRVEQFWQSEILPILDNRVDLKTAGERLIRIANTQNGHDNATVALIHCRVSASPRSITTELSLEHWDQVSLANPTALTSAGAVPSQMKTQPLALKSSRRSPWGLLLGIIMLSGLGGVLAYLLVPGINELVDPWLKQVVANNNGNSEAPATTSLPATPAATPATVTYLEVPTVVQLSNATTKNADAKTKPLLLRRGLPSQNQAVVGAVGAGSVLEVISKSPEQQENWLQVRVCTAQPETAVTPAVAPKPQPATTPAGRPRPQSKTPATPATPNKTASVTYRQAVSGDGGWIKESDLISSLEPNFTPTSEQRRECLAPASNPTTSPTPKPS